MRMRACSILVLLAGCSAPLAVHRQDLVLADVAARYHSFYPSSGDPDPAHDAGLLRPRFGLPAIAQVGASFPIELLERGGPALTRAALVRADVADEAVERCLSGQTVDGCHPLALDGAERRAVGDARRWRD
jgi:hypothetical protein